MIRNIWKKLIFPFRWDGVVYPIFAWWKRLLRPLCRLNGHRFIHMWSGPLTQSCDRCGLEVPISIWH